MLRIPLYEVLEKCATRLDGHPTIPDHTASTDRVAGADPVPVVAEPVPTQWDEKQLAEYLHIRYEKHTRHEGGTHTPTTVPFDTLPEAHKRTLLLLAHDIQVLLTRVKHEGFIQGK